MLPSSGYFFYVSCPLSAACERPQCLFRHASGMRRRFVNEIQSSLIDSTEDGDTLESAHEEESQQLIDLVTMEQRPQFYNHSAQTERHTASSSPLECVLLDIPSSPEEKRRRVHPVSSVDCKSVDEATPGPSQCPAEHMCCAQFDQELSDGHMNLPELLDDSPCRHTQICPDTPPRPDSSTAQEPVEVSDEEIIVIHSNSEDEDEPNLDVDCSDSDPMEECYRIFMDEQGRRNKVDDKEEDVKLIDHEESPGKPAEANETEHTESPEHQSEPSSSAQTAANLQPAPAQDGCVEYIAEAVIDMGNNLCVILTAAGGTSSATPALTPISQEQTSPVTVKQTHRPPVQRGHTKSTVLIPAQACKRSRTSSTSTALTPASPETAVSPTVKPGCRKRKSKRQQPEAPKVPRDIRQKYVNDFTAEFYKTTANVNDAFNKALDLERSVYNRSINALRYQSVAVNALKSLKNQRAVAAKDDSQANNQTLKGNIPLNLQRGKKDDAALYEALKDYVVSEEMLSVNYPSRHPEKPGSAVLSASSKKSSDPRKRICCRCGATYVVCKMGKHVRQEECNYHYGKAVRRGVAEGNEMCYSCCEGVLGTPGCQASKLHVHDSFGLDGFVSTAPRPASDKSCPGVYSLDCEMCYTIHGRELSRVTLVNSSLQVIYDTFVRPANEVIDYDTRFTGIREEDVKGNSISLGDVQETLLSFISADTILIGHSLETDFCALKLLHRTVVDTSVVFPHRLGPPHKLSLNSLTAEYLRKIIQEKVNGHDTAEDATAAMELMLWKVKKDAKLKK